MNRRETLDLDRYLTRSDDDGRFDEPEQDRIKELEAAIREALYALDNLPANPTRGDIKAITLGLDAALITDDTLICLADDDGQPTEQEEWRDYDPDC